MRISGLFQHPQKQHGRPCTVVGGRPWLALRTPERNWIVAARKTRAMSGHASISSWETSSIPGACVPRAAVDAPENQADNQLVGGAITAQPGRSGSTIDEIPALASAGLTDQVESRRPYPPSSLGRSSGDLDDSRAVCPISRYFNRAPGPQVTSYAH